MCRTCAPCSPAWQQPLAALLRAGHSVDSIDYYAGKVRELEAAILEAREAALAAPACASYFVFFNNQADAAIAAQVRLQPVLLVSRSFCYSSHCVCMYHACVHAVASHS